MEDSASYALNGKIMLCSVIILFLVVLIMVCLHGARGRLRSHHSGNSRRHRLFHHHVTPNTIKSSQGLNPSVLKALSTFTYPSKTHDSPPECAVCLSDFVDDERGRVLPQCGHAFHVECIDTWFQSHSDCPVCRASVQPDISDRTENEPAGLRTELDQREAAEMDSLGFSQPVRLGPSDGHRKPLELVGIVVEMPRLGALDEVGSGSPGGHRFTNPGNHNRVLSLKRICSI